MKPSLIRISAAVLLVPMLASAAEKHAVFKSTDRGRSWVRSDSGMDGGSRINAFGSLDDTLFAGTDSGIFISEDDSRSWLLAEGPGRTSGRITSFASSGGKAFAGTDGRGILISADKGKSWVPSAAFPGGKVRCLLAEQERLYAGTDAKGVFVSRDGGQVWTPLQEGFPADAQVFALTMAGGKLFAGLYSKGLYGWDDAPQRWEKAGPVTPLALATIGDTLVAGHNPGGLHWSIDSGASWSTGKALAVGKFAAVLSNDSGEISSEAPVWDLAANEEQIFAGAAEGIYYSEDRGRSWVRARAGLPQESPGVSFLLKRDLYLVGTLIKGADGEADTGLRR